MIGEFRSNLVHIGATVNPVPAVFKTDVWGDFDFAKGITLDGNGKVSRWNDALGSGHDLIQATEASRPSYSDVNGVTFDSDDDFLKTASATLGQPTEIFAVLEHHYDHGFLWDGNGIESGVADEYGTTPLVYLRRGVVAGMPGTIRLINDKYAVFYGLYNTTASKIRVNNYPELTGTIQAGSMDGFTMGAAANGTLPADVKFKRCIIRTTASDAATKNEGIQYLIDKYAIDAADQFTYSTLTLTATGNGTGVASLNLTCSAYSEIEITGTGKIYTDIAGTLNETNIRLINSNSATLLYIRVSSGTAILKFTSPSLTRITEWTSGANAPALSGNLNQFANILNNECGGTNTLTADVSLFINLEKVNNISNPIFSGDISGLTKLQVFRIAGTNSTVTYYTVAAITGLSYLQIHQSAILTTTNINQLLADMWANRDATKPWSQRIINLMGHATNAAPTGQGLIDKAALAAAPYNYTVTTR